MSGYRFDEDCVMVNTDALTYHCIFDSAWRPLYVATCALDMFSICNALIPSRRSRTKLYMLSIGNSEDLGTITVTKDDQEQLLFRTEYDIVTHQQMTQFDNQGWNSKEPTYLILYNGLLCLSPDEHSTRELISELEEKKQSVVIYKVQNFTMHGTPPLYQVPSEGAQDQIKVMFSKIFDSFQRSHDYGHELNLSKEIFQYAMYPNTLYFKSQERVVEKRKRKARG